MNDAIAHRSSGWLCNFHAISKHSDKRLRLQTVGSARVGEFLTVSSLLDIAGIRITALPTLAVFALFSQPSGTGNPIGLAFPLGRPDSTFIVSVLHSDHTMLSD